MPLDGNSHEQPPKKARIRSNSNVLRQTRDPKSDKRSEETVWKQTSVQTVETDTLGTAIQAPRTKDTIQTPQFVGPITTSDSGKRYILTLSDYCSKWVEAVPMPTKHASGVAQALFNVNVYNTTLSIHLVMVKQDSEGKLQK